MASHDAWALVCRLFTGGTPLARSMLSPGEIAASSALGKAVKPAALNQTHTLCPYCLLHRCQIWGDGKGGRCCHCPECGQVSVQADDVTALELDEEWFRAKLRLAMVLWVTGLLPLVLQQLDEITWKVGASTLSVRTMIEGVVTACAVLIVTLWISSAIEARLLRSVTGSELSVRKAFSNAVRALLMFLGLILALSAVGIDLTALSVLGGAVGVGIGFGLQKLAANYVSGFVILAERSVRIGDNVRVDGFEGRITDITGRYTLIRSGVGRESIVPNEMLITQRVENLSLADPRVWMSTVVTDSRGICSFTLSTSPIISRLISMPGFSAFRSLTDMSLA